MQEPCVIPIAITYQFYELDTLFVSIRIQKLLKCQ